MIIDAFTFFNETEMLEFRLRYLWDYVDKFVIVEANITHQGNPKPWNFDAERFAWAKEKIIYHQVTIDTTGLDFSYVPKEFDFEAPQWKVENQQRNAIMEACKDFSDDDIFMLSDCDEIPTQQAVEFRRKNNIQFPFACDQRIVAFYLNYVRDDIGWRGTIMCTMKQMREYTPQGLRNKRIHWNPMPHGGYHLTFFGGASQVAKKIQAYAPREMNTPENTDVERIENLTKEGKGIFADDGQPLQSVTASFYPVSFLKYAPSEWWV